MTFYRTFYAVSQAPFLGHSCSNSYLSVSCPIPHVLCLFIYLYMLQLYLRLPVLYMKLIIE